MVGYSYVDFLALNMAMKGIRGGENDLNDYGCHLTNKKPI